jgi:hypothetical protein
MNLNPEAGGGYPRTGSASKQALEAKRQSADRKEVAKQAVLEARRQVVSRKEAVRQASKQAVLKAKMQAASRREVETRLIEAMEQANRLKIEAMEQADRLKIEKVKERKGLVSEARVREKIRNRSRKRKRSTAGKHIVYGKGRRLPRTSKALDRTKVRVPYPGRNKEHI